MVMVSHPNIISLLMLLGSTLAAPHDEHNKDAVASTSLSTTTLTGTVVSTVTHTIEPDTLETSNPAEPNTPTLICPHSTESCKIMRTMVYPPEPTSLVVPGTPTDMPTFTYDPQPTSESPGATDPLTWTSTSRTSPCIDHPASSIHGIIPAPSTTTTHPTTNETMATSWQWPTKSTSINTTIPPNTSALPTNPSEISSALPSSPLPSSFTTLPPPTNATPPAAHALDLPTPHSTTPAHLDPIAWAGIEGAIKYSKRRQHVEERKKSADWKGKRPFWSRILAAGLPVPLPVRVPPTLPPFVVVGREEDG